MAVQVVSKETLPHDLTFADACRAAFEKMLARGGTVMMLITEVDGRVETDTVPHSDALEHGLVIELYDQLYPEGG